MGSILRARGFWLSAVAGLLVVACAQPIRNVSDAPVPKTGLTGEQMAAAIKQAGTGLGWTMKEMGPGKMEATLRLRTHVAVVDIAYGPETYSITYKESTNLDYAAKEQRIHRNYNSWIQNLENAIRVHLSNI